jgi:hypothetical protein
VAAAVFRELTHHLPRCAEIRIGPLAIGRTASTTTAACVEGSAVTAATTGARTPAPELAITTSARPWCAGY